MSLVLKKWINGSRRLAYSPGISIHRGNVIEYTFNNGFEDITYLLTALTNISSLPVEPNLSLFRVVTPKRISIEFNQQATLITMPGDIITINDRTKTNTGFGKVYCGDLDYDFVPTLTYYVGTGAILRLETTTVNFIVPAFYPEKLRWDRTFRETNVYETLRYKQIGIGLTNARNAFDFIVNISFEQDFNYAIADTCDLKFIWYINDSNLNINTLCQDNITYTNGYTMRYALTSSDVLTFRFVKLAGAETINVTQII